MLRRRFLGSAEYDPLPAGIPWKRSKTYRKQGKRCIILPEAYRSGKAVLCRFQLSGRYDFAMKDGENTTVTESAVNLGFACVHFFLHRVAVSSVTRIRRR